MKYMAALCLASGIMTYVAAETKILPQGASVEWSWDKAWKISSAAREKVCLNGLWEFRTENRWKPVISERIYYRDTAEKSSDVSKWSFKPQTFQPYIDKAEKTQGKGSICFQSQNATWLIYKIKNLPVREWINLKFDVKAQLEGKKFNIILRDAKQPKRYTIPVRGFVNDGKWHTAEARMFLPEHTRELDLVIPCGETGKINGKLWFDNIRVFMPRVEPADGLPPPEENWGYAAVPGGVQTGDLNFFHPADPMKDNFKDTRVAWYRRKFDLPQNWENKNAVVELKRVSTDAVLFINGQRAGKCGFLGGRIDVTSFLKPGESNEIAIMVHARDRWDAVPGFYRPPEKMSTVKPIDCGIMGDVYLHGQEKSAASLGKPVIRTFVVGGKKLQVEIPLKRSGRTALRYRCEIREKTTGKTVKTINGTSAPGEKKINISVPWKNAKLWEPDTPFLYEMVWSLENDDGKIDETQPEQFGFRQFEIRGRYFYLNGVKINLMPCSYWGDDGNYDTRAAVNGFIRQVKGAGYNFVYLRANHAPTQIDCITGFLEACDKIGILCAVTPLNTQMAWRRFFDREFYDPWVDIAKHTVMETINHPSLVMWRMNMNMNCYNQDQAPWFLTGKKNFDPKSGEQLREDVMTGSNNVVRKLDPTRPVYNHACGKTGDVYNLNNYLGWPEMQDIREWLKYWAKEGIKPLFMAEHAHPYPGDFQLRDPQRWWKSEPLFTEYGAILLGERAYHLEDPLYVDFIPATFKRGEWLWSYYYTWKLVPEIIEECTQESLKIVLPHWRAWGISGGINVWENSWRRLIKRTPGNIWPEEPAPVELPVDWKNLQRPGHAIRYWHYSGGSGGELRMLYDLGRTEELELIEPTGRAPLIKHLIAPKFAFIGGPADKWYTREHGFYTGETVHKSIVIINDSRKKERFELKWQLTSAGTVLASGSGSVTVPPAEQTRFPFSFKVPELAGRMDAELSIQVKNNKEYIKTEPFAMQFFPRSTPAVTADPSTWRIFDPAGKSSAALAKLGIRIQAISGNDEFSGSDVSLLLLGSGALDKLEKSSPLWQKLIPEALKNGTDVLLLEQGSKALEKFYALRTLSPGVRTVWRRIPSHPAFQNITDTDLRDWRGATSRCPPEPPAKSLSASQRKAVWRCSQEGVVASVIVEKPHNLPFRPLLDTGFDLRYTPLFEVPQGKGRLVFCELDLTDRIGKDPAATRLAVNLLNTYGKAEKGRVPVKFLELKRGFTQDQTTLGRFMEEGGMILAAGLTADEGKKLAAACGNIFTVGQAVNHLNPLPSGDKLPAVFAGISTADTRWRKRLSTAVIQSADENCWRSPSGVLAYIPCGKGGLIWYSATPGDFSEKERPDLVFSRIKAAWLLQILRANQQQSAHWPDAPYADTRTERDDPYAYMRW